MSRSRRGASVLGLLLAVTAVPASAAGATPSFTLVPAGPGVYAALAVPGDTASVGNGGFVVGSDRVLVVDSFATPQAARELLAQIRRMTRLPVGWLVNTHHHRDHIGGNAVFAKEGAVVVAHENARARIRLEEVVPGADAPPRDRELRSLALPSATYRDRLTIWLGDRRVEILSRPGHTGGDSIVWVPDANVLFGGDLVQKATLPNLSDARTDLWVQTLDGLAASYPAATFVPGHGGIAHALDLRALRDYLVSLRLAVAASLRDGKSGASLAAGVISQLAGPIRSWTWNERIEDNVADVEEELTGRKVFPEAPPP